VPSGYSGSKVEVIECENQIEIYLKENLLITLPYVSDSDEYGVYRCICGKKYLLRMYYINHIENCKLYSNKNLKIK